LSETSKSKAKLLVTAALQAKDIFKYNKYFALESEDRHNLIAIGI
jgi:hypothetical protein